MLEDIICAMLEYWSVLLFIRIALQLPLRKPKRYIVVYSVITTVILFICSVVATGFQAWMGILFLEGISVFLLYEGNWKERLGAFYLSYLSFSIISGWLEGIVALSYKMDALTKNSFVLQVANCTIFYVLLFLYDKYRIPSQELRRYKKEWYTFPVFFVVTITCIASHIGVMMLLGNFYDEDGDFRKTVILITMIAEFTFILIAVFLWLSQQKKSQLQRDNIQKEQYIRLREQQYHILEQNERAIQTLKHDMDKHLDCIHSLLEKGCVQEANQYIERIIKVKDDTIPRLFKSGNLFMDILLTELQQELAFQTDSLEIKGEFPKEMNMEAYDITTLFGNLFHNAAEAVKQMSADAKKYVHISFHQEGGYFTCIIDNTYVEELKKDKKGNYLTTKKNDEKEHGYGIKNAKQIVENYNGEIWFEAKEGHFKVDVILPIIKNKLD
ncbi:MAG: GHKL domain-containing protein [Clostridiales bacterium]|nr:GHKL domain-containing protein [Clostridiales bacterium]